GDSGGMASVTTDADGTTAINGGAVNAGVQDYQDDVTLGANAVLTGTTVSFEKTLNGDATANNRTLQVNASGATTFGGAVGNSGGDGKSAVEGTGREAMSGG